jgi:hypothetical protein
VTHDGISETDCRKAVNVMQRVWKERGVSVDPLLKEM